MMVAYSFKRRFVTPIKLGLSGAYDRGGVQPKRQTIRSVGKRRHARAGDELQLYHGMRTRQCFLIGRAVCTATKPVVISFTGKKCSISVDHKRLDPMQMDDFARNDGFAGLGDMVRFWLAEHGSVDGWEGVLIQWEPLR